MKVRIETLPAMWVASVRATGETPESEAWRMLQAWAEPRGLFGDRARHPVFGFNNPPPTPGQPDYGYELWVRVDEPDPEDTSVTFKQFEGGVFAVTSCRLTGEPDIVSTWRRLWDWTKTSGYRWRAAQELERVANPGAPMEDLVFDLYLPVRSADGPPPDISPGRDA